jgi:hypothetical protein
MEEERSRRLQNKVLRRICARKTDELLGDQRKLQLGNFQNLSPLGTVEAV